MKTTSVRSDDNKIDMTVTLDADTVKKQIDKSYKNAAKVRIPGFRPGKAPRKVLENYYGGREYFLADAAEKMINETVPLAIDSEGHIPLDKVNFGEFEPAVEGQDYSYSANFTVGPVYELTSYEPVQIELPSAEPTEDEINVQIDVMLNYYVDLVDITDRPVEADDVVTMDIELTAAGERIEVMSGEKIPYMLGSGVMPKSFDDKLLGLKIGKSAKFDLDLAEEEQLPAFLDKDKPVHAELLVTAIQARKSPELTDEFVKEKLEFDSVEDFRNQITESLKFRKTTELASLKDRLVMQELALRLNGEPTELVLSQTEQDIYRDFFSSLQQSGQSFDAFLANANITPATFRDDIKAQAKELASQTLALDAWARHFELAASDDDLRHEFEVSGVEDPDALYKQWQENGRLSEIRGGVLRMKASEQISSGAEVFEPGKRPAAKKTAAKKTAAKKADAAGAKDAADSIDTTDTAGSADTAGATTATAKKTKTKEPADKKATDKKPAEKKAVAKKAPSKKSAEK